MRQALLSLTFFFMILILSPPFVHAHPGRTAADGCHYCRTNCDSWGVPWNERHCHGGGSVEAETSEQQPVYVAPTNTPRPLPTWTPTPRPPTPTNTPRATNTPVPTKTPTIVKSHTFTPTAMPTEEPTSAEAQKPQEQSMRGFWGWVWGLFF